MVYTTMEKMAQFGPFTNVTRVATLSILALGLLQDLKIKMNKHLQLCRPDT